jgi:hypothetical protein
MTGLLLSLLLVIGLQGTQDEMPVFRVEADVITFEFSMFQTLPIIGIRRPYTRLKIEQVAVGLDKQTLTNVKLVHDWKKPGSYLVSFTPPEEYRDGESHLIELTLSYPPGSKPITWPKTVTIPKRTVTLPPTETEPSREASGQSDR